MSFMNRSVRRVWNFHPASFGIRSAEAGIRKLVWRGPELVRMLLVCDGVGYTSEQQFAPIGRHAGILRERLGVVAQYRKLDKALAMAAGTLAGFDVIGLKLSFKTPAAEAERIAQHFARALHGTATQLVYFDGDDDPNVQWHGVISAVHLYVKKHVFADDEAYVKKYLGKSNLTDYVAQQHDVSFADDIIPTSGGLNPLYKSKIHLGWNIGLDDKIFELSQRVGQKSTSAPTPTRDIDISCRASVPPTLWTHGMRNSAVERMEALPADIKILAPRDRVSQEKYYEEMLRSKICVSPFGFGELCWRDFEAILCGCLLVKPDMGHLKTLPDLFIPHGTYVPVRWDYSDLQAQCAPFLSNENERLRIVERAREVLLESLTPEYFVARFAALLTRLKSGVQPVAGAAQAASQCP